MTYILLLGANIHSRRNPQCSLLKHSVNYLRLELSWEKKVRQLWMSPQSKQRSKTRSYDFIPPLHFLTTPNPRSFDCCQWPLYFYLVICSLNHFHNSRITVLRAAPCNPCWHHVIDAWVTQSLHMDQPSRVTQKRWINISSFRHELLIFT